MPSTQAYTPALLRMLAGSSAHGLILYVRVRSPDRLVVMVMMMAVAGRVPVLVFDAKSHDNSVFVSSLACNKAGAKL